MTHNPFGDFVNQMNLNGLPPEDDDNAGQPAEQDAVDQFFGGGTERDDIPLEPHAEPTMAELFNHSEDNPDIAAIFNEFMDALPNPNETSLWESKLDPLQLQLRGLLVNEVYQNFVDGHFPEWMPDAEGFATMEDYRRAKLRETLKIKYLISFAVSLMTLAEQEVRRALGDAS